MVNKIEPRLRELVTACVSAYLRNGGKMKWISEQSGVSAGAIKRMADGDTAFPRFHTIEAVLTAFGNELSVQKADMNVALTSRVNRSKVIEDGRPQEARH